MRSLGAEIFRSEHKRTGEILLHAQIPHLRVASTEVGIDGEGVRRCPCAVDETVCHGERAGCTAGDVEAGGQRRLLRHGLCSVEIDRGVYINAVATTDDE